MRRNGHPLIIAIAVLALSLARCALSVAAPDQTPVAHSAAAPAPAARPAEPAQVAAAPSITNSPRAAAPQSTGTTARSAPIDRHSGNGDKREDRSNRNQNLNSGNYGYAGFGYYPYLPAYNYWNPYYNNYNGSVYPGQFTQPDTAITEPNESADQTLSAPVTPEVTPPQPAAVDTTSAALNSALIASPQWRDADAQVRSAQSEYDAASAIVLAQLRTQPAYQQALAQKAADAQKLNSIEKKNPTPPMDRTQSAASAKLSAAETVTQMETAALAADPRASAAKAKLDAAVTNRLEIRRQIEASLPRPPKNQ
jgi:hypothetical protein